MKVNNASKKLSKDKSPVKVRIIGIGGIGLRIIDWMVDCGVDSVSFVAVDTDKSALKACKAKRKLYLDRELVLGANAIFQPDFSLTLDDENASRLGRHLGATDLVFIVCAIGGSTGGRMLSAVTQVVADRGMLSVVYVVTPPAYETKYSSNKDLRRIQERAGTLITIPVDQMERRGDSGDELQELYESSIGVVGETIRRMVDVIDTPSNPALIGFSLSELRASLGNHKRGYITIGGDIDDNDHPDPGRCDSVVESAIANLWPEKDANKAVSLLVSMVGDLTLGDVAQVAEALKFYMPRLRDVHFGAQYFSEPWGLCIITLLFFVE